MEPARFPGGVPAAVRRHHEDYGGGGYPAGLSGEEIPLLARILRVADAYDAMTSARPYRQAFTPQKRAKNWSGARAVNLTPGWWKRFCGCPRTKWKM